jgi:hypothetical protein
MLRSYFTVFLECGSSATAFTMLVGAVSKAGAWLPHSKKLRRDSECGSSATVKLLLIYRLLCRRAMHGVQRAPQRVQGFLGCR